MQDDVLRPRAVPNTASDIPIVSEDRDDDPATGILILPRELPGVPANCICEQRGDEFVRSLGPVGRGGTWGKSLVGVFVLFAFSLLPIALRVTGRKNVERDSMANSSGSPVPAIVFAGLGFLPVIAAFRGMRLRDRVRIRRDAVLFDRELLFGSWKTINVPLAEIRSAARWVQTKVEKGETPTHALSLQLADDDTYPLLDHRSPEEIDWVAFEIRRRLNGGGK